MWRGRKDFEDFSTLDTLPLSFRFRIAVPVEALRIWPDGLGLPFTGEVAGADEGGEPFPGELDIPAANSVPGPPELIELSRDVTLSLEDPGNLCVDMLP